MAAMSPRQVIGATIAGLCCFPTPSAACQHAYERWTVHARSVPARRGFPDGARRHPGRRGDRAVRGHQAHREASGRQAEGESWTFPPPSPWWGIIPIIIPIIMLHPPLSTPVERCSQTLRLVKYLCDKGAHDFRRAMARQSASIRFGHSLAYVCILTHSAYNGSEPMNCGSEQADDGNKHAGS